MNCPRCQREISPDAVSCSSCGLSFNDATQPLEYQPDSSAKPDKRSFTSLDSIDDARFVPGTILAERYRIVGLLGKGGMGEVYRADDLKLAQPVALKFLPDHLLSDAAALARFHREVRVARQVSHKNICRVYDIGEADGRHFLSMEFIKGEELSSLLRRIGRLPQDKALQLARQICAGLAAAHDIGFIHRDLKPANIMIDGDGNARVLDFGLGGLAEEFAEEEIRAGTPAYMSPEQIEGKEQTVRSDIYSLGLVLYELFTGKRAFEAPTLNELIKLRRSDKTPTTPTSLVKDLDPLIEKVINRCLEKNPEDRPASALTSGRGFARRRSSGCGARRRRDTFTGNGRGRADGGSTQTGNRAQSLRRFSGLVGSFVLGDEIRISLSRRAAQSIARSPAGSRARGDCPCRI